jgi:hypothetical protein
LCLCFVCVEKMLLEHGKKSISIWIVNNLSRGVMATKYSVEKWFLY